MSKEIKALYQRKKDAQAALDELKAAGASLRENGTDAQIILMDIKTQRAFDASLAADEVYAEAIKTLARS